MRTLLVFAAFAVILTAQGCCAQDGGLAQGVKAENAAYGLGESVKLEYAIHNASPQPLVYNFPTSQQYDIWVSIGGDEVFRLSRDKMYTQAFTSLTLQPGETKTFCATWNQKDFSGKQVGPGIYTISAQLTTGKNPPPAAKSKMKIGMRGAALVPVTVKEAIANFTALSDKRVQILATYKGWSPDSNDPNIKDGPPVTRSDWAISDATGSMYVVGKSDYDTSTDVGKKLSVIGKLKKTDKGQVYLILESATAAL